MGNYFTRAELEDIEISLAKVSTREWLLGAIYSYGIIRLGSYYFFHV